MKKREVSSSLSKKYREGNYSLSLEEKEIYLKVRMPATAAVIQFVLQTLIRLEGQESFDSILDCGCGPGSLLRALECIPISIKDLLMIDRDDQLLQFAREHFPEHEKDFVKMDLRALSDDCSKDVVLFSYSLNEVDPKEWSALLKRAFFLAKKYVVIIEPGTPKGYGNILKMRDILIQEGGKVVAPCPHEKKCPLQEGDWCHFGTRLNRSKEHRLLKGGALSYEDEKFSYLIFSKEEPAIRASRILRRPTHHKGWLEIRLCTTQGIKDQKITKSKEPRYKEIKERIWGEEILNF